MPAGNNLLFWLSDKSSREHAYKHMQSWDHWFIFKAKYNLVEMNINLQKILPGLFAVYQNISYKYANSSESVLKKKYNFC